MNKRTTITIIMLIWLTAGILAQQQPYSISRTQFSTTQYNEFAPAFYRNGLVFCTDRGSAVNSQGQAVVKMFYADTAAGNSRSKLFSKDLKTRLNDGPASFSPDGDTIYFSRNLVVEGNLKMLSTFRNKLGVFYSVAQDKGWGRVREMRYNTEWFNITMPCLSHDGKRLYFASDKPDGLGGLDIYYSDLNNGYWEDPVNLGSEVNTEGNETYPFISETGELFFSSDGRGGLGGKDIFVTKQKSGGWYTPVRLAAPLNSEYDDFGLITTATMNEGYFSSDRDRSNDIYHFTSTTPQIWFAEPQKENLYCFTVSDTGSMEVDTTRLRYVWNFGDNDRMNGTHVKHCFPGPGKYNVTVDLIDRRTGNLYFRKQTYDIEIVDYNQPYINSPGYAVAGDAVEFDAMKSFCPGYTITGYYWDFGDGTQKTGAGPTHTYKKNGEFDVRLGLTLTSKATGDVSKKSVTKKIRVYANRPEMESSLASRPAAGQAETDLRHYENVRILDQYSAAEEYRKEAVFQVEILSSPTKMELTNPIFRSVPAKYSLREVHDPAAGKYSYVVDQQMTLMAVYPAYSEIVAAGFKSTTVRLQVLTDPAEKELNVLKRNYGVMTDTYFDSRNRLVTNAYLMLDQVVMLMNKYPGIKIEIAVHTDNQGGSAWTLQRLSETRAQVILDYLVNRGISASRLTAKGYGDTRPVSPNATWLERRMNRRVDFTIIK